MDTVKLEGDKQADKLHLSSVKTTDNKLHFGVYMTDKNGKIVAWGIWPKQDWERMKLDMERIWQEGG